MREHADQHDAGAAFMADTRGRRHGSHTRDSLAQALAERFVTAINEGGEPGQSIADGETEEELGGPYLDATDDAPRDEDR